MLNRSLLIMSSKKQPATKPFQLQPEPLPVNNLSSRHRNLGEMEEIVESLRHFAQLTYALFTQLQPEHY